MHNMQVICSMRELQKLTSHESFKRCKHVEDMFCCTTANAKDTFISNMHYMYEETK